MNQKGVEQEQAQNKVSTVEQCMTPENHLQHYFLLAPIMAQRTPTLEDILLEEDVNVRQAMYRVCRAMIDKYGQEIGTKMADKFIECARDDEFNADEETLRDELQTEVAESHFVENLANHFENVLSSDSAKAELATLLQTACDDATDLDLSQYLNQLDIQWTLTKKQSNDTEKFLMNHCRDFVQLRDKEDHRQNLIDILSVSRRNGMYIVMMPSLSL